MIRRCLVLVAAAFSLAGARQEPAPDPLDAVVKSWADVKLWIKAGDKRVGWMRYRVRWGEYKGDRMVEVQCERATLGKYSGRFTAWLNPDRLLSPRAIRVANDGYDWENVGGKFGMLKNPTPKNLSLFPELLAAVRLPKEGVAEPLSLPKGIGLECAEADLKGAGSEGSACKVALTAKSAHFAPEGGAATFWIGEGRAPTRVRAGTEEWIPATEKEWSQEDAATNEFRAAVHLTLLTNQAVHLRSNDADGNSKNDFWTGDVSGLYRVLGHKSGEPIGLIPREMAAADAAPLPPGPEKGGGKIGEALSAKPVPFHGFLFQAMTHGRISKGEVPLNEGSNRNEDMFGFCVYPASYGKTGKLTYFVDENNNVYSKDLKGQPVLKVPAAPHRDGWTLVRRF